MARDGVLIIGYGSPLRGDDAAGPRAARLLADRGFQALEVHQLTPELAENVAAAGIVFFLDAHAELLPGEAASEVVEAGGGAGTLEHHASPAGLLRLAADAYGAHPRAWLVGMGGENFEVSDRLSPAAERAVARAIEEVIRCTNRESSKS